MGAYSVSTIINVICDIIAELHGENIHVEDSTSTTTSTTTSSPNSTEEFIPTMNKSVASKIKFAKKTITGGCMLIAFILFSSRSISSFINYGGKLYQ